MPKMRVFENLNTAERRIYVSKRGKGGGTFDSLATSILATISTHTQTADSARQNQPAAPRLGSCKH